jgi:hypothetical protein
MLAVNFWLHRFTAALLSHTIITDRILILPDLARTLIATSPAKIVGSQIRDHAKAELGLVKMIADPAIFNQSSRKSVFYSHEDFVG